MCILVVFFQSNTHFIYCNMALWHPKCTVTMMGKITYEDDSPSYDCYEILKKCFYELGQPGT